MVRYGYIWLYMVIYGYIWLYMVIYGYIWLYMAIYGYISLYIWLYMVIHGYIWLSPIKPSSPSDVSLSYILFLGPTKGILADPCPVLPRCDSMSFATALHISAAQGAARGHVWAIPLNRHGHARGIQWMLGITNNQCWLNMVKPLFWLVVLTMVNG